MKKITAWETIDKKLFRDEDDAREYEKRELVNIERKKQFEDAEASIKEHVCDSWNVELEEVESVFYEGNWGWTCDDEKNPIDKCVYACAPDYDESCVFCGEPEERK